MVKLFQKPSREVAVLFCILAVALAFATPPLPGLMQKKGPVAQMDPCDLDAQSSRCLQSRIGKLEAQLANLQKEVEHLQKSTAAANSIGDPQRGKADGYDDIWGAIEKLTNDVNKLKQR